LLAIAEQSDIATAGFYGSSTNLTREARLPYLPAATQRNSISADATFPKPLSASRSLIVSTSLPCCLQ
jgi:hypothetical protein